MTSFQIFLAIAIFCFTVMFIVWRPGGINEAVPAGIGAVLLIMFGIVPIMDTLHILDTISGAVITILSTIMMSLVLDSIGFFRWTAQNIIRWAKGSGTPAFFYICSLCFLMTLFFNNDGSILITTPIIIHTLAILNLKLHEKLPYLFAGALVATASSAPIAVSNLANLIALKIVGLDINSYVNLMFVPTLLGILTLTTLLYFYFRESIPKKIPELLPSSYHSPTLMKSMYHPDQHHPPQRQHPLRESFKEDQPIDLRLFRLCIGLVILTRASLFIGSSIDIPMALMALTGATALIWVRWKWMGIGVKDVVKNSPWHILVFAFSIYVVIHGLHLVGLTTLLVDYLKPFIVQGHMEAIFVTGTVVTVIANLFNNIPAVMIGTITLTEMELGTGTLQVAYLANIIGSDLGALISPMGTLATLLWMYILRKNKVPLSWRDYFKVAICVVPLSTAVTLFSLYAWSRLFF